ncbi:TonB-dependent receptor [Aquirhabdus sp.]|uniref:TonB-dependent receptor n=1 Tax=Aquirhabdus sp. TaxID=2824160 RepID=UPI00396CB8B6
MRPSSTRHPVHPLSFAIALLFTAPFSIPVFAAENAGNTGSDPSTTPASAQEKVAQVEVKAKRLDQARNGLSVETGGSSYRISEKDIANMPQGDSTPMNQVLLQAPGVAQDSYGQLHVRGDHDDLQYRIDGVILPESISGFGQTLDPSFIKSINLLTGTLPAQYGYRTAGVVDIQTKTGAVDNSGSLGISMGSNNTREVMGSVSGSQGNLNYFLNGSFLTNNIGIENPTSSKSPIHDTTDQFKGFGYFSYLVGDASRVSLILGSTNSRFQIPNSPGQPMNFQLAGVPNYPSENLTESQDEITHYGVLSFQSSIGDQFDYQLSAFSRYTSVNFNPDNIGDLIYTGVASQIARSGWANGLQADGSYRLNPEHTIRVGAFYSRESLDNQSNVLTFPADDSGNQTSDQPVPYNVTNKKTAYLEGIYLQDEWKATDKLTINYGGRYDHVDAYVTGDQFSPRLGAVYQLSPETMLHAGYARYFTPPPMELVSNDTIAASVGTTNAPANTLNDPVKSESSNAYDIGISHKFTPQLTMGLDSYYKQVTNLLDEGQFGSALLYTPFNYAKGKVYGVELTANYHDKNFSAYGNLARATALGKDITSSQYTFDNDELAYISNHEVHLDHDQMLTASAGMSYQWHGTTCSADALYGSGLRSGFANTEHLPSYVVMNAGVSHDFQTREFGEIEGRFSVVNLFDHIYEIRDGSGIGVGAPQYGARRELLFAVSKKF